VENEYAWDVFVPGEDLPRRVTTDYIVTDGELISVDGRSFLVERVDVPDDEEGDVVPLVYVDAPHEPAA
jgi:hypothetical protein